MKFNINEDVWIQITEHGHEYLNKTQPNRTIPKTKQDADGTWEWWQLWVVMSTFGEKIYNGCKPMFKMTIEIPERNHGDENNG